MVSIQSVYVAHFDNLEIVNVVDKCVMLLQHPVTWNDRQDVLLEVDHSSQAVRLECLRNYLMFDVLRNYEHFH